MKGKALRKQSLHGKIAAYVLLSCSSVVTKYSTPLHPIAHELNSVFKCLQHTIHDPWGQEKYKYTLMKYVATFCSSRYRPSIFNNKYFWAIILCDRARTYISILNQIQWKPSTYHLQIFTRSLSQVLLTCVCTRMISCY